MKNEIIFVVPTLGMGGMERVVNEFSKQLILENHTVKIITLINHKIDYKIDDSVDLILSNIDYNGNQINKLKILKNLYLNLKNNSNKNSIIIAFGERFNVLSIIASKLLNLKIYVSDRNNPYYNNGKFNNFLRNIIYPSANGIIAQTLEAKKYFFNLKLNKNISVIYNPLKIINYKNVIDNKNILMIGRLDKLKNQSELIDIFMEINDKTWKLILVGGGEIYQELKDKIFQYNFQENIILEGKKENIDDYLNNAEIFAFTSLTEGFPNALNEAMSIPLACITYDCKVGPSEIIINKKNGLLIPLHDKQKFKLELKKLMSDKDLRNKLKTNAIEVRNKFSLAKQTKELLNFINSN